VLFGVRKDKGLSGVQGMKDEGCWLSLLVCWMMGKKKEHQVVFLVLFGGFVGGCQGELVFCGLCPLYHIL
jgi:hypothetical protein